MILSMRMDAVHRDIASGRFPELRVRATGEGRGIAEIRSFRRAFVKAYGYTPSTLRAGFNRAFILAAWHYAECPADIKRWFES